MAIQGVKGQPNTYYVIKGTTNPASMADYWSSLVTKQKEQLYNQSLNLALQEAKTAENRYEAEQKAFLKAQQEINKQQQRLGKEMRGLQVKQLQSAQDLLEAAAPVTSTRETMVPTGGSSTKTRNEAYQKLQKRRTDLYVKKVDLQNAEQALEGTELAGNYADPIKAIDDEIKNLDQKMGTFTEEEKKEVGTTTKTGGGRYKKDLETTRTKDVSGIEPVDFTAQIAELQKELDVLDAVERQSTAPEKPSVDVLGRTREIAGYSSPYTLEEEPMLAQRAAQMEERYGVKPQTEYAGRGIDFTAGDVLAPTDLMDEPPEQQYLGEAGVLPVQEPPMRNDIMEPAPRFQEPMVEPQPFGTPEFTPSEYNLFQELTRGEGLKLPDQGKIKEKRTEKLISNLEKATRNTRQEAQLIAERADKKGSYQELVKQLYSAAQGAPSKDRVVYRDNAYQELEKVYGKDPETFDKAVELLITLDSLEMGTLPDEE